MSAWEIIGLLSAGGLWTLFVLMVGIGVGKAPYTPPRDARRINVNGGPGGK
jgi:hypothetical protein